MRAWLRLYGYLLAWLAVAAMDSALERYGGAVQMIAASSYCPAHFLDKDGKPRLEDLAFAVEGLTRLELDPVNNIGDTYVPEQGGKVHYMAEIQRTLARRHGIDLEPAPRFDDQGREIKASMDTDETHSVWRGRRLPDGEWKYVRFEMAEADKAGWSKGRDGKEKFNYRTMPARMMLARGCTQWISLHAPEVLRELAPGQVSPRLAATREEVSTAQLTDAPSGSEGGHQSELHTVRRDEPTVSPERIAHLKGQIQGLSLADQDSLRSICKSLHMPNIDSAAFTLRDAALLHRLIAELMPEGPLGAVILDDDPDDPTRPFDDD